MTSPTGPVRFVILAERRSGSHLLQKALTAHPGIRCRKELLLPRFYRREELDAPTYLERKAFAGRRAAEGFILHRAQWRTDFQRQAWQALQVMPDLRIVDLRRRDLLARFASQRTLPLWKYFHENRPRIHIDPTDLLADTRVRKWERTLAATYFAGKTTLRITYEELTSCWAGTIDRILDLLGQPRRVLSMLSAPSPTPTLPELIVNHAEVEHFR